MYASYSCKLVSKSSCFVGPYFPLKKSEKKFPVLHFLSSNDLFKQYKLLDIFLCVSYKYSSTICFMDL